MKVHGRPPRSASVIIPACNEGDMLHMTVENVLENQGALPFEILIVDDGSTDGSCDRYRDATGGKIRVLQGGQLGVARARNLGAQEATGEMLVFLDGHCTVSPAWLDRLAAAMRARDVALVSPAFTRLKESKPVGLGIGWASPLLDIAWYEPLRNSPYEIPLACGACQAFPADAFDAIGRFEEGFTRWGYEDVEIALRCWLLGYRVVGQPQALVKHWFRETRNYTVDDTLILYNLFRMVRMHFSEGRMHQVVEAASPLPQTGDALKLLGESDIEDLRNEMLSVRMRDDDWFFSTFQPELFAAA
jgi:GT2 family glycosyltransferase